MYSPEEACEALQENDMNSQGLEPYIALIDSFLRNEISATRFEQDYLHMFKRDHTSRTEDAYNVLNDLFGDVDAFCSDPDLCGPEDLNEEQLRKRCQQAYERLKELE